MRDVAGGEIAADVLGRRTYTAGPTCTSKRAKVTDPVGAAGGIDTGDEDIRVGQVEDVAVDKGCD